jgi:quercetin dioxygenase-like cupin family protein
MCMAFVVCQLSVFGQSTSVQGNVSAPGTPGVAVTDDPTYHLLLENPSVRAFQVEIAPGQSSKLHWHDYDYMVITLADSVVGELVMKPQSATDAKKHRLQQGSMATVQLDKKSGDEWRTKGGILHMITNKMSSSYRNVTLEFPQGEKRVPETTALILKTGQSVTKDWKSKNHLFVFLSNAQLTDSVPGQPDVVLDHKAGEVAWIPAGALHTFTCKTELALITVVEFG